MSQNESTPFLVTDAKNLTLIDATRENSPWCNRYYNACIKKHPIACISLKGGINSFVWSTKAFLYDIREPRYKQIKMGYQISKCLNIGQS